MQRIHELSIDLKPFRAIMNRKKRFEYRKNDRDFKLHDYLKLSHNGMSIMVFVEYVLYGPSYGIPEGFCVMSILRVEDL